MRLHPSFTICVGLLMLAAVLPACNRQDPNTLVTSGQIEGVSIGAGSRIGGRVTEVLFKEGDRVKKGDVLVRLDDSEPRAAVAAAEAQVAQAQALLAKAETGARPEQIAQVEAAAQGAQEQLKMAQTGSRSQEIRAAAAAADVAKAMRDQARAEFDRVKKLFDDKAVSQQVYDQAKHAAEAAEANYKAANEQRELVAKGARDEQIGMAKAAYDQAAALLSEVRNGTRTEDLEAARAMKKAAESELERAKVALSEMVITAPRDAIIESMDIRPGDIVRPGAIAFLVDPDDLELVLYVSAKALGFLKLGQEVPLQADSHGGEVFKGVITQIATEGEYTPRNLQTQEERVRQMFGITLKLDSAGGKLRPGMSVTAKLSLTGQAAS